MRFEAHAATDIGRVRSGNEDSLVILPETGVLAVADGMGGHAAGEVASRIAAETVSRLGPSATAQPAVALRELVAEANRAILARAAADPECAGMGTTLTALLLPNGAQRGHCGHIGDSRLYQLRHGVLRQITRDHTWVQDQIELGALSPEQGKTHPYSSALTRALGIDGQAQPDLYEIEPAVGDVLLLCSDGLTGMVTDQEIALTLGRPGPLEDVTTRLIAAANAAGGTDNITVVIARILS